MKSGGNHMVFLVVTVIITLLPMVLGICTWGKLPESVAIHFGMNGTPNGWAPKWVVVFLVPLVMAAIQLILYFSMEASFTKGAISNLVYIISMLIVPLCAVICAIAIYGKALK